MTTNHQDRCPNCWRDFEGCECSAAEGGIGHDSFEDRECDWCGKSLPCCECPDEDEGD